jgi:hypothetical protein
LVNEATRGVSLAIRFPEAQRSIGQPGPGAERGQAVYQPAGRSSGIRHKMRDDGPASRFDRVGHWR